MKDDSDSVTSELPGVRGTPKTAAQRQAARRARLAALGVVQVQLYVHGESYRRGREDGAAGVNPGVYPPGVDPVSYLAGWQNARDFGGSRLLADLQAAECADRARAARRA